MRMVFNGENLLKEIKPTHSSVWRDMNKTKQKRVILNENLWKVTFKLSWPAILAMVLYGLNTVFDAFL